MNSAKFITLDNGLTILIYSDKSKSTNHVELITFFGGNNTSFRDKNDLVKKVHKGTAHLLEHYICEQTDYGNLISNLKNLNVLSANACTNSDATIFYFDTVRNFSACLRLFLTSIFSVSFDKDKLEKTKVAVFNEIRDDKDNISREILDVKVKNIFDMNVNVLGNKTSIKKIGHRYLKDIYENIYVPKNQLLVVAGNFDEEIILKMICVIYEKLTFKNNKRIDSIVEKRDIVKKEDVLRIDSLDEVIMSFKIDTRGMNNFNKYKFDWYLGMFGSINFSKLSKFNDIVRKDKACTGDVYCGTYLKNGYNVLEIMVYTNEREKIKNMILNTVSDFRNNKRDDFDLRKKASLMRVSVRKDSIKSYVSPIIDNYILFGYPHDDTLEFIESLNYDEYIETISQIDFSNYSVLYIENNRK